MLLTVLGRREVRALLPIGKAIELMDMAMRATASGLTIQPPRWMMDLPTGDGNLLGLMPSFLEKPSAIAAKITAVYPGNPALGLQSHQGVVVLFEANYGRPIAILHGAEITALRTAAASALATRELARIDASHLAVLGYGEQAVRHIQAIAAVRPITHVSVWGRSFEKADQFSNRWSDEIGLPISAAATVEEAIDDADIICTVSGAPEPILFGAHLTQGVHINVVGSSSARFAEIDTEALLCSRLYVDLRSAVLSNGGDIRRALDAGLMAEDHIVGDIGEVLIGSCIGRTSECDITLYKSVGIPVQDLVCAIDLVERAAIEGIGTSVEFE